MQDLQKQLETYSSGLMTDPSAGLAPIKAASTENINRRYAAMPAQIAQSMASRGYGSSGNFGNTMFQTDYARSGELSNLDSSMAQMILAQQNKGADLSGQLLQLNRGTTTTGTGPGTSLSDAFMSGGNGLSNLSTLLMLQKVLGKTGSGGAGSGSGSGGVFDDSGTYVGE